MNDLTKDSEMGVEEEEFVKYERIYFDTPNKRVLLICLHFLMSALIVLLSMCIYEMSLNWKDDSFIELSGVIFRYIFRVWFCVCCMLYPTCIVYWVLKRSSSLRFFLEVLNIAYFYFLTLLFFWSFCGDILLFMALSIFLFVEKLVCITLLNFLDAIWQLDPSISHQATVGVS